MIRRRKPVGHPLSVYVLSLRKERRCGWQLPPIANQNGVGFDDCRISPAATDVNVCPVSGRSSFATGGNLPRHG